MIDFQLSLAEVELFTMEKVNQKDLRNFRKLEGLLLLNRGLQLNQVAGQLEEPAWRVAAWAECYQEEGLPDLLEREFNSPPPPEGKAQGILQDLRQNQEKQSEHLAAIDALHRQLRNSLPPHPQSSDLEQWLAKAERLSQELQEDIKQSLEQLHELSSEIKP